MISTDGIRYIKKWDSEPGSDGKPHLSAYRDSGGVLTIGYGQTQGVTPGMTISEQEAEDWFRKSLKEYTAPAREAGDLTQGQFDAMTSFAWNAGPGRARKAINIYKEKGFDAMAGYMRGKVKDRKGNRLSGLVRRREEELAMFQKHDYAPSVSKIQNKSKAIQDIKTPGQMAAKPKIEITRDSGAVKQLGDPSADVQLKIPKYQTQLGRIERYKQLTAKFSGR